MWLSGNVNNQHEADKAVSIARGTEGVRPLKSDMTVKTDHQGGINRILCPIVPKA